MSAAPDLLDLDDLRVYARCSLAWFWRSLPDHEARPRCADLFEDALREGLERLITGGAGTLTATVIAVWRAWGDDWHETGLVELLLRYAHGRADILARLPRSESGRGVLAGTAPATPRYRQLLREHGLLALGRRLDAIAETHGLRVRDADAADAGSRLGDAFADALWAAEQWDRDPNRPAGPSLQGLDIPFRVSLTSTLALEGRADWVLAGDAPGGVVLELHDYDATTRVRAGDVGRDLRVIAGLLAQPPEAAAALRWERVQAVRVRFWRTGQTVTVREANPGYLLQIVASLARGMRQVVIAPRALNGQAACQGCAEWERCWSPEGWQSLPLVAPALLQPAALAPQAADPVA